MGDGGRARRSEAFKHLSVCGTAGYLKLHQRLLGGKKCPEGNMTLLKLKTKSVFMITFIL